MDPEIVKLIATASVICVGTIAPAIAISRIGTTAAEAIGRNPEASSKVQSAMILSLAFAEAIAIYALVIAFSIS